MKKLLTYLRAYKKESLLGPLFKLLEATLELLVPLVVAAVIDRGIAGGDTGYILRMCLLLVGLGAAGLALSVTAQYFAAKAATGFVRRVRHALFAHIQRFSYAQLDTLGTSTLITRMTSDVNQVQSGLNLALRLLLRSPFVVFGAMIMAFTIDVPTALVFAVAIPALSVVVFGIMLACIPLYKKVQQRLDRVLEATRGSLTGVRVLRAFCREEEEKEEFSRRNQALTDTQKFVGRISALMNPATYVIINLAIVALVRTGALRVEAGLLTQGAVVALYNYMSQILVELIKLANLIINITKAVACANRIQAVLDVVPEMENPALETVERASLTDNNTALADGAGQAGDAARTHDAACTGSGGAALAAGATPAGDTTGADSPPPLLQMQNVSLCYPGAAANALYDIDLSVEAGQTVGIIGGTGSGKSSLVDLIPRFYEASAGAVLVKGRDVRDWPLDKLRQTVGIVPQKAVLFKGTIRENLLWGDPNADEDTLWQALTAAQAADFVRGKPEGLEAAVEQGGRNFSGGQRQRLTIARALVRRPDILILDDSASALDFATDAALRKALRQLPYQPTVLIVSQRTSSLQHADQILVLEDGHAAGLGRHEQLLRDCPVYREIYDSQYRKEDAAP